MSRIYGIAKMAYQAVKPIKERCAAKAVCRYYKNSKDAQIRKAVSYVKKAGRIQTFNAPFAEAYKSCFYKIKKDPGSGLFFVNYRGRPMYFSRDYFTVKSCLKYMRSILAEQDLHSPHRYLTDGFAVDAGSVVVREFVVEKTLKLEQMEFFPDLNMCSYDQLPRAFQRRINETVINVYLVNPATPANVKFNIFKRINTGGLELEPQEIRNALFQGKATIFLQECARMDSFLKATDGSVKSERMLDREFVLRYISFCYLDLNDYTGNIDEFLNEGMKFLNNADDEQLYTIRTEFISVMESMYCIMGRNAFRRICKDGRRRPINKAIFESWCYAVKNLSQKSVECLICHRDRVQKKYMELCENNEYLYRLKAPDRKMVCMRIKDVQKLVDSFVICQEEL